MDSNDLRDQTKPLVTGTISGWIRVYKDDASQGCEQDIASFYQFHDDVFVTSWVICAPPAPHPLTRALSRMAHPSDVRFGTRMTEDED